MRQKVQNQRLHFITGKGGTGKSLVAAGLALSLAAKGEPTWLVELGETTYFSQLFSKDVSYLPQQLSVPQLAVSRLDPKSCLKEFVGFYLPIPRLAEVFFDQKITRYLMDAAPALRELALLGKITSGIREIGPPLNYSHIVVDAYSSGHFMGLMKAPTGMAAAISSGPMGKESRSILATLMDSKMTQIYVVTLPEELVVTEALEFCRELKRLSLSPILVRNKWLPEASLEDQGMLEPTVQDYVRKKLNSQAKADQDLATAHFSRGMQLGWLAGATPYERVQAAARDFHDI